MAIIPNSYQKPNFYSDDLAYLLTANEQVVLDFACRWILGWRDSFATRRKSISVSFFVGGNRLSRGCGLGRNAVITALAELHKYGILVKLGESQNGAEYFLQDDEAQIDLAGLEARKSAKRAQNASRTQKARQSANQPGRDEDLDDGQADRQTDDEQGVGGLSDKPGVVCGTNRQVVCRTNTKKANIKAIKIAPEKQAQAQIPDVAQNSQNKAISQNGIIDGDNAKDSTTIIDNEPELTASEIAIREARALGFVSAAPPPAPVKMSRDERLESIRAALNAGIARAIKKRSGLNAIAGDPLIIDQFPSEIRDLAEAYSRIVGRYPVQSEVRYWQKSLKKYREIGITVEQMNRGYENAMRNGMTIKSPESLLAFAEQVRQQSVQRERDYQQPAERYGFVDNF